jgi:multiple sugar transport system permease protein
MDLTANSPTRHIRWRPTLVKGVIYAMCIGLAVVFLFPIAWSMITSLKPAAEASSIPPTGLPSRIVLENYRKLNEFGAGAGSYLYNSISVSIMTVLGSVVLSTLAGYGFSRFSFPGKALLFLLILATLMIPFQSILTPLFLILNALGLDNTLLGLALVYVTFQLPFGVFVMRNSFDTVPRELEEAALLDGCSSVSLLYRVMLPIVLPGVITAGIYAFLNAWNEFLAALIFMNQQSMFTFPILLNSVNMGLYGAVDWGALQAGVTISIVPSILLFLLLQRYYIQGLTGGSVKA